jgi:hypothetical protein
MKIILLFAAIALTVISFIRNDYGDNSTSWSNAVNKSSYNLTDGMYLVIDEVSDDVRDPVLASTNHTVVNCSELLIENNDNKFRRVIIDTSDYVPLILKLEPRTEQQTETKKKILIELTRSASNKLEIFTTVNLNKRIALIIGNEVISMHGIKMPITGGQFQISYCGPDMCEILMSKLVNNVDTTDTK